MIMESFKKDQWDLGKKNSNSTECMFNSLPSHLMCQIALSVLCVNVYMRCIHITYSQEQEPMSANSFLSPKVFVSLTHSNSNLGEEQFQKQKTICCFFPGRKQKPCQPVPISCVCLQTLSKCRCETGDCKYKTYPFLSWNITNFINVGYTNIVGVLTMLVILTK